MATKIEQLNVIAYILNYHVLDKKVTTPRCFCGKTLGVKGDGLDVGEALISHQLDVMNDHPKLDFVEWTTDNPKPIESWAGMHRVLVRLAEKGTVSEISPGAARVLAEKLLRSADLADGLVLPQPTVVPGEGSTARILPETPKPDDEDSTPRDEAHRHLGQFEQYVDNVARPDRAALHLAAAQVYLSLVGVRQ